MCENDSLILYLLEPQIHHVAQIVKRRTIIFSLALALVVITGSTVIAQNVLDYNDIKTAINAAYSVRSDLLLNSRGTASFMLDRREPTTGMAKEIEEDMSKKLGIGPDSIRTIGKGGWITEWYQKGSKRRYDIDVPNSSPNDLTRRPFLIREKMRVAVDPEKSIYYDTLNGYAYINQPPVAATNPLNLQRNFDIRRLYKFNNCELPQLLSAIDRLDKSEWQYKLIEDKVEQIRCIKLDFAVKKKAHYILWVAPEFSYSLVKGQLFLNKGGVEQLAESYEATYQKSASEGVWLLKNVTVENNQGPFSEKLEVKLSNTEIGIEISDETFTFKGLGVPLGTKIYDKSLGGQPIEFYYGSFPVGEIDDLAKNILEQQNEFDSNETLIDNGNRAQKDIPPEINDNEKQLTEKQTKADVIDRYPSKGSKTANNMGHSWLIYSIFLTVVVIVLVIALRRISLLIRRKGKYK